MTPRPTDRLWALAPLAHYIATTLGVPVHQRGACPGCHGNSSRASTGDLMCLTVKALANALDRHTNQIYRWRDIGLTDQQADELAVQLGTHPARVWGDDWRTTGLSVLDELHLYGTATAEPGWRQAAGYPAGPTTVATHHGAAA